MNSDEATESRLPTCNLFHLPLLSQHGMVLGTIDLCIIWGIISTYFGRLHQQPRQLNIAQVKCQTWTYLVHCSLLSDVPFWVRPHTVGVSPEKKNPTYPIILILVLPKDQYTTIWTPCGFPSLYNKLLFFTNGKPHLDLVFKPWQSLFSQHFLPLYNTKKKTAQ